MGGRQNPWLSEQRVRVLPWTSPVVTSIPGMWLHTHLHMSAIIPVPTQGTGISGVKGALPHLNDLLHHSPASHELGQGGWEAAQRERTRGW